MNTLRKLALIPVLALSLVAATCDEQARGIAVQTCKALDTIYAHYDGVAASGAIPARYMNHVAAARVQTDKVCASPSTVTTVTLLRIAGEAYLALRAALQAGQGQGDPDWDATQGLQKLEALRRMIERAR